jgi:hypothetical protein
MKYDFATFQSSKKQLYLFEIVVASFHHLSSRKCEIPNLISNSIQSFPLCICKQLTRFVSLLKAFGSTSLILQ